MNHTPIYIAMCYAIGSYRRAHPRNDIGWADYVRSGAPSLYLGRA